MWFAQYPKLLPLFVSVLEKDETEVSQNDGVCCGWLGISLASSSRCCGGERASVVAGREADVFL